MDKTKQPGIRFDNVILKEINFFRKPEILPKSKINMTFNAEVSLSEDNKKMACELMCRIEDDSKSFQIKCSMIGLFSTEEGKENMDLKEFAEGNAPALIFPFLRELVASITTKAGMAPLLLPPMNIKAMLKTAGDSKVNSVSE